MENTKVCKDCNEEKVRIHSGYKPNCPYKIKLFKDEKGSQWNGNRCPDCQNKSIRVRARRKLAGKNKPKRDTKYISKGQIWE